MMFFYNFGDNQRMHCALLIRTHCLAVVLAAISSLFLQLCRTWMLFNLCISPNLRYHHRFSKFCTPLLPQEEPGTGNFSIFSIRMMCRRIKSSFCHDNGTKLTIIQDASSVWSIRRDVMLRHVIVRWCPAGATERVYHQLREAEGNNGKLSSLNHATPTIPLQYIPVIPGITLL